MSVRSRFRLKSLGLAPRLVALAVLLASLAGGSIAFSIISSARTALRDEILEAHLALADMMAAQISEYVSDVRAEALDLAERPEVTSAFAMNDFTVLNDQLAKWQTRRQDKIDSFAIYSIDSIDGTPLANSRATRSSVAVASSINAISRAQAVETGQPVIGRALLSKTSGTPIVPIYVPVHSASGNVEGVFCATLSLEGLTRSLVSLQLAPNSRRSVMDNVTGDVLVSEDPTKILTSFTTGRNAASQAARNGERGTMENTRSVGEATLAAYTPVPDLRWAVLLQEPSSDAFAPIDGMTRQALIWVSAAMLLAGLLAAGLALTMVRPLRKLRTTAERMASGDLGRRTGVRSGDEIGALGHAFDRMAEQLQDSVEELTRQALSDTLTALPNRVLLRQRLENAIACGDHLALLVMDLDRFKEVNDTLGHLSGDRLLQQLAQRLKGGVRRSDTIARLGGDEFAVVLPGAGQAEAVIIAEALQRLVGKPFDLDGRVVTVGVSIGIAGIPEHGPDADTLLRCADVAMYVAKHSGQGVSVYAPEHDQNTPDRLTLIGELSDAIARGELTLAFQPLMDCQLDEVAGVEALVRWQHPRHGLVLPDQFIPLAEQTGLIRQLSRWVLEAALQQHHTWLGLGLDVPVSVNLSMRDLHDPGLPSAVADLVEQYAVRPGALRVEITESSLMSDPVRALKTLKHVREMGVDVSIDDFGTGYSSLAYLKQLPVDELKIDRSFVRDMAADESDLAIVRSTIDLAHNLGLAVVAEGVEDDPTLEFLRSFGCDKAQGFLFTRPLAADEITRWLLARQDSSSGLAHAA